MGLPRVPFLGVLCLPTLNLSAVNSSLYSVSDYSSQGLRTDCRGNGGTEVKSSVQGRRAPLGFCESSSWGQVSTPKGSGWLGGCPCAWSKSHRPGTGLPRDSTVVKG